jgi:hypothetical protein
MTNAISPDAAKQRLQRIAAQSPKAPAWLRDTIRALAERVNQVGPVPDSRQDLPEFIYRH